MNLQQINYWKNNDVENSWWKNLCPNLDIHNYFAFLFGDEILLLFSQ